MSVVTVICILTSIYLLKYLQFGFSFQIREDVRTGVYVENLTEECVSTMKDVTKLLMKVQTAYIFLLHFIRQSNAGMTRFAR